MTLEVKQLKRLKTTVGIQTRIPVDCGVLRLEQPVLINTAHRYLSAVSKCIHVQCLIIYFITKPTTVKYKIQRLCIAHFSE